MYPRCPKCGQVSRLWLHKLIPDMMIRCPACKTRLGPLRRLKVVA